MWIPVTLIVSLSVALFLPKIIISSLLECGKIKNGKLICRCPKTFRIILLMGVLMFSCFVFLLLKKEIKGIEIALLIIMILFDLIFIIPCYICMRYKIVMDIDKQKIVVYRLHLLKKEISFSNLCGIKKGNLVAVNDKDSKTLFYYSKYMSGAGCLENCLNVIVKNNQRNEPINIVELQRLFENEIYFAENVL